jgi:hypothetical protein
VFRCTKKFLQNGGVVGVKLAPNAFFTSFGTLGSQMPKLYKAIFLQTLKGVFRSILQKKELIHQNFLQTGVFLVEIHFIR